MKKPPITLVVASFLVLCLAAPACAEGYGTQVSGSQPRQEQATNNVTPTASATVSALTRDALRNAEYAANFPSYGTLQRDRIGAQDPLAFGDLDGDGTDDAAVVLLLVDGNAGYRYLAAVLNEYSVPRHVASVFLGLNIGIDSVTIAGGVVTLQTKQLGPNDPNCCPTKEVAVTFRLTDNAWQLLAETPPGSVTSRVRLQTATPTPIAIPMPSPAPTLVPAQTRENATCLTISEQAYLAAVVKEIEHIHRSAGFVGTSGWNSDTRLNGTINSIQNHAKIIVGISPPSPRTRVAHAHAVDLAQHWVEWIENSAIVARLGYQPYEPPYAPYRGLTSEERTDLGNKARRNRDSARDAIRIESASHVEAHNSLFERYGCAGG